MAHLPPPNHCEAVLPFGSTCGVLDEIAHFCESFLSRRLRLPIPRYQLPIPRSNPALPDTLTANHRSPLHPGRGNRVIYESVKDFESAPMGWNIATISTSPGAIRR